MELFEHGGNLRDIQKDRELADFSANINPYGLSKEVKKALLNNIEGIVHYPEPDARELRGKIAAHYNIGEDKLILGNGAVELIYLLCHLLQPKNVLIVAPGFSEYERAARSVGANINYAFLDAAKDFQNPMRDIIVNIKDNDILFIGNPNNPTGTLYTVEDMELLIDHAENNGCFVVVDESFMDFIKTKEAFSSLPLVEKYHNLLVLQSMTKFYAIPGLRLGFAATDREVLDPMYRGKDPWNVNSLAQAAGLAALEDETYQRRSRTYTRNEINYLYEELLELPKLKVFEPTVNFILLDIRATGKTAGEIRALLIEEGIVVRDCSNYPGLDEYYIRVAVRTREENDELIDALNKILKEL